MKPFRVFMEHPTYIKFIRLGFDNACIIARQSLAIIHALSKPCLINLISKDTHLVFSMYIAWACFRNGVKRAISNKSNNLKCVLNEEKSLGFTLSVYIDDSEQSSQILRLIFAVNATSDL